MLRSHKCLYWQRLKILFIIENIQFYNPTLIFLSICRTYLWGFANVISSTYELSHFSGSRTSRKQTFCPSSAAPFRGSSAFITSNPILHLPLSHSWTFYFVSSLHVSKPFQSGLSEFISHPLYVQAELHDGLISFLIFSILVLPQSNRRIFSSFSSVPCPFSSMHLCLINGSVLHTVGYIIFWLFWKYYSLCVVLSE